MDHQLSQQESVADPSLIDRVARLESAVVESCRQIEDQHLAAVSLRERLHQVDSALHASGDRLETILDSPADPGPPMARPREAVIPPCEPEPAPEPEAPQPDGQAPPRACPAASPIEAREDDRVPPLLLPYLVLLAVAAVLPWLGAWFPGKTTSERTTSQTPAHAPGSGTLTKAAAEPLPLPDDSRERALRLVYSFSPPGRKETVFDILLRSAPPALREDVERVDQDSYLVTLGGVKLGPGDGPARFEANLAEGTVSVVKEDVGTGSGTAQSAPSGR